MRGRIIQAVGALDIWRWAFKAFIFRPAISNATTLMCFELG
jgi:hypothetical protein